MTRARRAVSSWTFLAGVAWGLWIGPVSATLVRWRRRRAFGPEPAVIAAEHEPEHLAMIAEVRDAIALLGASHPTAARILSGAESAFTRPYVVREQRAGGTLERVVGMTPS